MKNYYSIYKISCFSTQKEIKKKYHELAKKYHPDKSNYSHKEFQLVNEAYQTLSNPIKKITYDKLLQQHTGIITELPKKKNLDISCQYPYTLEKSFNGGKIKLTYNRNILCKHCEGFGVIDKYYFNLCKQCHGNGYIIQVEYCKCQNELREKKYDCVVCRSTGKIMNKHMKCIYCNGFGNQQIKQEYLYEFLPGTIGNIKIEIDSMGHEALLQKSGNLIINFIEKNHNLYKRNNNDLLITKRITLKESLCPFSYKLPLLNKKQLEITENNIIQPETTKRLLKRGLPIKNTNQFGNLYIYYQINYPTILTNQQMDQLSSIL